MPSTHLMPRVKFESLAELLDCPSYAGDGRLRPPRPTWRSFADWVEESDGTSTDGGICIRVSPSWFTPRWSTLKTLGFDSFDGRWSVEDGGDAMPRLRWTTLRETNYPVDAVAR